MKVHTRDLGLIRPQPRAGVEIADTGLPHGIRSRPTHGEQGRLDSADTADDVRLEPSQRRQAKTCEPGLQLADVVPAQLEVGGQVLRASPVIRVHRTPGHLTQRRGLERAAQTADLGEQARRTGLGEGHGRTVRRQHGH